MRIALRRMRAALALFKDVIASTKTARIKGELKWLSSVLGRARDRDVFASRKAKQYPMRQVAAERITEAVRARRLVAHHMAAQAICSARYKALIRTINNWNAEMQWSERLDFAHRRRLKAPLVEVGRQWLHRSARYALKAGNGVKHLNVKQRHRLRIALKQLRYDTEFLSSLYAQKK